MYKFMLIILSLVVVIFTTSCAKPLVAGSSISSQVGLPFGTVLTLGGKKMVVISQENEEVRLKPYTPVIVKAENPKIKVTKIISDLPKPEWDSKIVITEGIKNVQECLNPSGCPQDTKTGECLEGCVEQKVRVEMRETIIDPTNIDVDSTTGIFDHDLILTALLQLDIPPDSSRDHYGRYFGTPSWMCIIAHRMGTIEWKTTLTKIIHSTPNLLEECNRIWAHENKGLTPWTNPEIISSL
jgi:hypothetical protein